MDALSALVILAGPVSLFALLWSRIYQPEVETAEERETLSRELCGSLAAMNTELDRLALAAGHTRIEGKRAIYEEIGQIERLKEEMLLLGEKLRYPGPGEWGKTRVETLAVLERISRHIGGRMPDPARRG